jgi:hypothetical protein
MVFMNKSQKSQLSKYVLKKRNPCSEVSLIHDLQADKNLKILGDQLLPSGEYIVWIGGFGERGVYFVQYIEKGKKSYYCLSESPLKEFEIK